MAEVASGRRAVEARLDELVRANRFTIAVVFPVTGAVLLVASAEGWLPAPLSFNPWLVLAGVLVMRAPLVVGIAPLVDRRAAAGLAGLCAYAYAVEFVGVTTGWPYGEFRYAVDLGPTVGGIPIALPVFFLPLVANGYLLCLLLLGDRAARAAVRLPVVVAAVVLMDLVLDPGAVALGFWVYADGGPFYGVPVSNFLGWVGSATLTVAVLDRVLDRTALLARLERCEFMLDDLVSFVLLWGGVNAWFGHSVPVALAALFGLGLVRTDRFDAEPFLPASAGR
ncbi:MAG: bisanhydrobacterioruberin hydratase [Haloferacaceae archaeon]